jgi:membrane-bound metal-dependent hydrolase YbcI (DUF457 family)
MLLWFAVLAPIVVAEVFRSPMVDYRLVAAGAVLPLAEVVTGGPRLLHTLLGAVLALTVVMLLTVRRRLVRRRLLGVPIGLFLHLVLDGTWTDRGLFWWPVFGSRLGRGSLPELDHPLVVGLLLEALAIAAAVWAWRRYGLDDAGNRRRLLSTGHLDRRVLH